MGENIELIPFAQAQLINGKISCRIYGDFEADIIMLAGLVKSVQKEWKMPLKEIMKGISLAIRDLDL